MKEGAVLTSSTGAAEAGHDAARTSAALPEPAPPWRSSVRSWANLHRLLFRSLVSAGMLASVLMLLMRGLGSALLVLAATALVAGGWLLWRSLQLLSGDRSEAVEDALGVALAQTESEQKQFLLRALKDLEFERSVGKISEADYIQLKRKYRTEAKRVLRQLDQQIEPCRAEAEALVASYLAAHDLRADNQAQQAVPTKAVGQLCTCGTRNDSDARFCKSCGQSLAAPASHSGPGAVSE